MISNTISSMIALIYLIHVTVHLIYVTGNVWNQAFYRMPRQSIEYPFDQAFYRIPRQSIECQASQGFYRIPRHSTSKCMHGMNQTEAEYSRHGKRSQRANLSQIGPVVLEV